MAIWRSLRSLIRRGRLEGELDAELQFHLDREVEANLAHGMRPDEARPAAFRAIGRIDTITQDRREAWGIRQIDVLARDVRFGVRGLRRNPAFTLAAIVTLAIGIGATSVVFGVVDAVLLRPLPFPDPDRIVTIWQTDLSSSERSDVAPADFLDWRERSRSFEAMAAVEPWAFDYTSGDEPRVFFASLVTEDFFRVLRVEAVLGRTFLPEEHQAGRHRVVVLSDELWRSRFGAIPDIIGRVLILDDEPHTVVGILPADFELGLDPEGGDRGVYAPKVITDVDRRTRGGGWWNVIARLKAGVPVRQARVEMDAIAQQLAAAFPKTNSGTRATVVPLFDQRVGNVRLGLWLLQGAVVLVLLIACVNIANLLLARTMRRRREFAVRAAMGAGRAHLVRQLLTESLLLAVLGGAAAFLVTAWGIDVIRGLTSGNVPRVDGIALNARVVAVGFGLAAITALTFGAGPALSVTRVDLSRHLRAGQRSDRIFAGPFRSALVAGEFALALMLLVGAGLLTRSFITLVNVDPGFSAANTVALQVFAWDRNPTPERRASFFNDTLARIRALPSVDAAGAVSAFPFGLANIAIESPLLIEGQPPAVSGEEPRTFVSVATPDYFRAMGIPLLRGRAFTEHDSGDAPPVVLVNETIARRHWRTADPLSHRILFRWQGRSITADIVGVVGHVRHEGLDRAPRPEIFVPHAQAPFGSMTYVVRARRGAALIQAIKEQVWAVDPLQSFYSTTTVQQLLSDSVAGRRLSVAIVAGFAVLALALAAVGIYGVINFLSTQRTQEFGIRLALGADHRDILRLVLGQGMLIACTGLGIGMIGALAISRLLRGLLFNVTPTDPITLGSVTAILLAVAAVASYLPARRATRVDPLTAVRAE